MKRLTILTTFLFLLMSGMVLAGEYNFPLWQETNDVHTFISILNPVSIPANLTVTLEDATGQSYSVTKVLPPGGVWYIDTATLSLNGSIGSGNIFVNNNAMLALAISVNLYGTSNMNITVTRY